MRDLAWYTAAPFVVSQRVDSRMPPGYDNALRLAHTRVLAHTALATMLLAYWDAAMPLDTTGTAPQMRSAAVLGRMTARANM